MLEVVGATGGYGQQDIVKQISFSVSKGECFGILGPNGSGKTTLLQLLCNTIPLSSGTVQVNGKEINTYTPKELAKVMAVLPQKTEQAFSFTVKETVAFGRYPYQKGFFRQTNQEDEQIILEAMEQTGVLEFADKSIHELSGGEQQRVYLAQALAQKPDLLLLDEPTNFLDLSYQKNLLDLIKRLSRERQLTVIGIFHDLNLASLYCDRILLMKNGKKVASGIPEKIIAKSFIHDVYQTEVKSLISFESSKPQVMISPEQLQLEKPIQFSTCIKRKGRSLCLETEKPLHILSSTGLGIGWKRIFMNRHVTDSLAEEGLNDSETLMMTTNTIEEMTVCRQFEEEGISIFVVVIAGKMDQPDIPPVHMNIWVFINGKLSKEAFVQALIKTTEAKMNVLFEERNEKGISADNILIAATQEGANIPNSILMQLIVNGVNECSKEALHRLKGDEII